jgi:hypothetical protein
VIGAGENLESQNPMDPTVPPGQNCVRRINTGTANPDYLLEGILVRYNLFRIYFVSCSRLSGEWFVSVQTAAGRLR